ncbi:efflux RND transporter periplasmic adaptor subunit [Limnoglobus roseus]|uniref:Efflux RND transporter periplasmic adaptor subunit n=1 Tax=Limnoglobus roseus TaxID=2598579 RepID=A0A5C1ASB8_9BACT|nr:efflux RND transporter periplasmic adaptor subunit [Limnoglobus roseus]QEL19788.1 efflux RND transporter periplasmic adaptor subunit [Limnoglobus roseus]
MNTELTLEKPPVEAPAQKPSAPESHHATEDRPPTRPSFLRLAFIGLVAVGAFVALAYAGLQARNKQTENREATAIAPSDRLRVLTTLPEQPPDHVDQVLPGTAVPYLETAVYARTSGYLKRWLVDIGDPVKEGQLLAEIDTPEVNAQLLQARAALAESKANLVRSEANENLSRVNLDRAQNLSNTNAFSKQEFDAADAAYKVAAATTKVTEATIKANEASVKRLEDLQSFQKITAPFTGVVTARNFDAGALVVADNSANAKELFHLARIDTLRIFADVPQTYASSVTAGMAAPVSRREAPGREFGGQVSRTTHSLDPTTRTLRVQVDVPNADGALLPGMYLQVRFRLKPAAKVLRVPGAAVITRAEGTKVAIVDATNTVRYRTVKTGRDFGTSIEIVQGLAATERLVIRPGDDLPEGMAVEPVTGSAQ